MSHIHVLSNVWKSRRAFFSLCLTCFALLLCLPGIVAAQNKEEEDPFKPYDVDLATKDGVTLKATYFPGKNGKDSVPVLLLHMFEGSRGDWKGLAEMLHTKGHAVIALDLRGHGASTTVRSPANPSLTKVLTPKDVDNKQQVERMYEDDMETVKRWLLTEHNAGKMNIEKLCLIGAEMGSVVAVNWAMMDWKWPVLAGGGKQGQDVQALILLSPETNYKGVQTTIACTTLAQLTPVSVQIVVGSNDSKSLNNANQVYRLFSRYRPTTFKTEEEARQNQNLFLSKHPTTLQGTKMLGKNLGVEPRCIAFIELRLSDKNIPWRERTSLLNK